MMNLRFYPCGVGDLIYVELDNYVNLIIDSGYKSNFINSLKPILENSNPINLWILTHTDDDHIGGIVKLIESGQEYLLKEKVSKIWFNWSSLEYKLPNDKISVSQGMLLRDKISELGLLQESYISTETLPLKINDTKVYVLSPSPSKLEKSKVKWQKEERKKIGAFSDYHIPIEELLENKFLEDDSVWNGGSIAVLMESEGKRVMLLADAHPSVIIETLKSDKFSCTPENPIKIDCVKVSHHGSKSNTNFELLELIDCRDWVFCANGTKHGFPHKECISKIIYHRRNEDKPTRILFNHNRPTYDQVFGVDDNAKERYNFDLIHLEDGKYKL